MLVVFVVGFTSGCLSAFIVEWFRKNLQSNRTGNKIKNKQIKYDPVENEKVYRLALVVNKDLKMGDGKVVAQCAHAAVGTYESYYTNRKSIFDIWDRQGKNVSIYKVSDTENLKALYKSAKARGIISYLVQDAGRTQIASGSKTVLAIGPEEESILKSLTEYLLPYS